METVENAFALRNSGRYGDALAVLESSKQANASYSELALKAELAELVGRHAQAQELALRVLRSQRISLTQRATCENVIARILLESGEAQKAIEQFQRALTHSQKAGDLKLTCWIQGKLISVLAERSGRDAAAPLLADLRRNITVLGDGDTTAQAHMFVAEMEGRQGHLGAARRHVRIGQDLLGGSPNAWLAAYAENVLLAISILEGRILEAGTHSRRALTLSAESGAASAKRSAAANTGNLLFLRGDFEGAFEHFQQALEILNSNGERTNGILEALAQVRLYQDRPADSESFLARIEASIKDERDRLFYGHRYAELTRGRLLARLGHHEKALRTVEKVLKLSHRTGDELLHVSALLVKAIWLQSSREWTDCLAALTAVLTESRVFSPDVISTYNAILASFLSDQNRLASAVHYQRRSTRMFDMVCNVPRRIELDWNAVHQQHANIDRALPGAEFASGVRAALHTFAVVLTQVSRPEIAGSELTELLAAGKCIDWAEVIESAPNQPDQVLYRYREPPQDRSRERRFVIRQADGRALQLVCGALPDFESEATVAVLSPIMRRLSELLSASAAAERRAVLWPPESFPSDPSGAVISGHMRELMSFAQRVARTTVNVMITGESGTGKEILARAIHDFSDRAQKPFIPLNCAAVPRDLLESQLFGHRRGAFTGAERDQLGLIRSAEGGTLFLDEVGEMNLELQPKLLRFLEAGEIAPLGEPAPLTVNVRVVAATNAKLEDAVRDGRFREDLFYRLNVVRLAIKPLRERRDEIPALVEHLIAEAARDYRKGHLDVAEETMERLLLYRWPGNVRQLQNELRRMVALAEPNSTLGPDLISPDILGALPLLRQPYVNGREVAVPLYDKLAPTLSRIEYEMIKAALRENQGRLEPAAKALGISRKGLYLKRQRLGL